MQPTTSDSNSRKEQWHWSVQIVSDLQNHAEFNTNNVLFQRDFIANGIHEAKRKAMYHVKKSDYAGSFNNIRRQWRDVSKRIMTRKHRLSVLTIRLVSRNYDTYMDETNEQTWNVAAWI